MAKLEASLAVLAKALMASKDEWQKANDNTHALIELTAKVANDKKTSPEKAKAAEELGQALQKVWVTLDQL